jgi:hypothetical protein
MINKSSAINLFLYVSILIYLAYINYSFAYVNIDEFSVISGNVKDSIDAVRLHSRVSHLFSIVPNYILMFADPGLIDLIPRLLSMIGISVSIFYIANSLKINKAYSGIIIFSSVVLHQIDSYHNGLIAFFGGYNLFYFIYFIVLIKALSSSQIQNTLNIIILTLLLLISYSSEIFVIASILVAIYFFISRRDKIYNVYFISLLIYFLTFFFFKINAVEENIDNIKEYLVGNVGSRSIKEMMTVATLYLFNSIPYVTNLKLNLQTQFFALVIIFMVVVYAAYILFKKNTAFINNNAFQIFIVMCIVGIVPQLLMAFQPNKTSWALEHGISRYAFSLYTWILYVVSIFIVINKLVDNLSGKIKLIVNNALILGILIFSSGLVESNLLFIINYKDAKNNWKLIANTAQSVQEGELVKIDNKLLFNPGPLPINAPGIKKFISRNFQKQSVVCWGIGGFDFSKNLPPEQSVLSISGFSVSEKHGRWTNDNSATILLNGNFIQGDIVNLEVSDLYGENRNNPSLIKMNAQEKVVSSAGALHFAVDDSYDKLRIEVIPYKPKDLDLASPMADQRRLGLMVKEVSVIRVINGATLHLTEFCQ